MILGDLFAAGGRECAHTRKERAPFGMDIFVALNGFDVTVGTFNLHRKAGHQNRKDQPRLDEVSSLLDAVV